MTVYKNTDLEADAASKLAIALINGDDAGADALATGTVTDTDTEPGGPVRSGHPVWAIFKDNIKRPFDDGFAKASDVCTGPSRRACTKAGIS